MIVPDINLLLYATVTGFPQHEPARAWWEATLNGREDVGLTAPVIFGFLRLVTNRRVIDPPLDIGAAAAFVEEWLAIPHVRFVVPGPRHIELALRLLRGLGTGASLTTDAQIAALAIEHQGEVCSNDADFSRFPGLRFRNPLA